MKLNHSYHCSGEAAALRAASGDHCECADCHESFPGAYLYCYPHGNICQNCHEDRQDQGLTKKAFGQSPREEQP